MGRKAQSSVRNASLRCRYESFYLLPFSSLIPVVGDCNTLLPVLSIDSAFLCVLS